ncbi:MAG TPA: hypothetical protein ACFE0H_15580 [Elainellaceae cyanobacterium]
MNSSENGFSQPSTSASSSANQPDTRPDRSPSSPNALAETDMDQHSHQSTDMLSSASPSTSETASSQTSSSKDVTTSQTNNPSPDSSDIPRQQPIPPASEPMQYRAIGLMKGKYIASDEQFTRGQMETEDGYPIDAVLLGRVMSLVKKHLDLDQPHLWVVYPRTRNKDEQLHVQVVGVWEPENLNKDASDDIDALSNEDLSEDASDGDESQPEEGQPSEAALGQADTTSEQADPEPSVEDTLDQSSAPSIHERDIDNQDSDIQTDQNVVKDSSSEESSKPAIPELKRPPAKPSAMPEKPIALQSNVSMPPKVEDGYFSIRGEVVKQSKEDDEIKVKICQAPRHGTKPAKTFNLTLKGTLDRKAIGYFWDLHVQREGNDLVVQDGMMIGLVPPSKRSGKSRRGGASGPGRVGGKRGGSYKGKPSRPNKRFRSGPRDGQQPGDRPSSGRSSPTARPVKRRQNDSQSTPE